MKEEKRQIQQTVSLCTENDDHERHPRKHDALVLSRPPHMIIGVVSQLVNVGWELLLPAALLNFVEGNIAVLVRVALADCVAVTLDVFVWVQNDESIRAESSVDVVGHKPFPKDGNDGVIGDTGK